MSAYPDQRDRQTSRYRLMMATTTTKVIEAERTSFSFPLIYSLQQRASFSKNEGRRERERERERELDELMTV